MCWQLGEQRTGGAAIQRTGGAANRGGQRTRGDEPRGVPSILIFCMPRLQALDVSDKRFAAPSLRKLCTAVSLVGSSPPIFVVALAAALFVPLDRCQLLLF